MGPRVFTRGNKRSSSGISTLTCCFNGATRLHAWKLESFPCHRCINRRLQWGHASSRVETRELTDKVDGRDASFNGATRLHAWKHIIRETVVNNADASMGPRVFTRGNVPLGDTLPIQRPALQWGHASSRVETSLTTMKSFDQFSLQWG